MQKTLRIRINDERIFIGTFVCTDKHCNIILTNTEEFRPNGGHQGRFVGMIMIPWKLVLKVEVETNEGTETDEDEDEDGLYA